MNFFNKLTRVALLATASLSLWNCTNTDDPTDGPSNTKVADVTIETTDGVIATPTTATLSVDTKGLESYAYVVTEGKVEEPTEARVIYNDAAEIFELEDGAIEATISGLEGNTDYTVEFAFKATGLEEYEVKSVEFTTGNYEDTVSIISKTLYSVKFAISADEDCYYRYLIMPRLDRASLQYQFGTPDEAFLEKGAIGNGTTVIDYRDGDLSFLNYDDEEEVIAVVKPGTAFVIMVGACDAEGNLLAYNDEGAFTEIVYTYSELPAEAAGELKTEITTTEASAIVKFTPSEEIYAYSSLLLSPKDLGLFQQWAGEEGIGTELQKSTSPLSGEMTVKYTGISMDVDYTLAVVYSSDEKSETRSVKYYDVRATASDKPAVELVITDAMSDDPHLVSFNIKCPTKDCTAIRYLLNTTQAWSSLLAQGYDHAGAVALFGVDDDHPEIIDGINSDEGYVMTFDSWEDTESTLAIGTKNVDEKAFCAVGTAMSPKEPALPQVDSELFETLQGDWTTTYVFKPGWELNNTNGSTYTKTFKTIITDDPDFGPETFDESHPDYETLFDFWVDYGAEIPVEDPAAFAKKQIAEDFAKYKEVAAKFKQKYRDQNRLLMLGFTPYSGYETISTWDLFCDMGYSAYNVDQLFFDFGMKMFIEVKDGDQSEIVVDPLKVAPAISYSMEYYSAPISCTTFQGKLDYAIPLRITDDEIVISSVSHTFDDGRVLDNFYLGFYYTDATGTPYPSTVAFEEPVLTRGYNEDVRKSNSYEPAQIDTRAAMPAEAAGRFKRPYMPTFALDIKAIPTKEVDCSKSIFEQLAK